MAKVTPKNSHNHLDSDHHSPPSGGKIWRRVMGSMIVEMDARTAAYEDFEIGANANPYSKQSAAWRFYEAEYLSLTEEVSIDVKYE
jgi:hypothetical protein